MCIYRMDYINKVNSRRSDVKNTRKHNSTMKRPFFHNNGGGHAIQAWSQLQEVCEPFDPVVSDSDRIPLLGICRFEFTK